MKPDDDPYCHVGHPCERECAGDGWFNPCTLTAQRATGVQFNPASASNQLQTEDQDTGGRGED